MTPRVPRVTDANHDFRESPRLVGDLQRRRRTIDKGLKIGIPVGDSRDFPIELSRLTSRRAQIRPFINDSSAGRSDRQHKGLLLLACCFAALHTGVSPSPGACRRTLSPAR
jgi:hypothetical protein